MNKKLILPLFLLFPAITQCMEKEIVFKPKTMQDIRDERSEIYKEILEKEKLYQLSLEYKKNNPFDTYDIYTDQIFFQRYPLDSDDLSTPQLQDFRFKEYSFLSFAIIAVNRPIFTSEKDEWGQKYNLRHTKHPKPAPFKNKKATAQSLLKINIQPTSKDKYLALLTKYEKFGPSIIKKLLNLQHLLFLSKVDIPQEIIPLITLLMWDTEESLF
jgi:hypothetical protein